MTGRAAGSWPALVGAREPQEIEIDGERLVVRRSWPGKNGVRSYECCDASGRIRALTDDPRRGLTLLPHARDRKLPSLRPCGQLLVHRAGKRAVERVSRGYRKHLRAGGSGDVVTATHTMGGLAASAGFAVPRVLGTSEHSVMLSTVPGVPLLELSPEDWGRAWGRWSVAWPRLVRGAVGPSEQWQVHDAAAEAAVVAKWFEHVREYDAGGLAGRFAERLDEVETRVCRDLSSLQAGSCCSTGPVGGGMVPAHRDLHDGQMLFDPATNGVGLLDFDTAVLAERELDLANLDVHLELRVMQGLLGEAAADVGRQAIRQAAVAVGADARRLETYREATRARLGCVYAFRWQWVPVAERMLEGLG